MIRSIVALGAALVFTACGSEPEAVPARPAPTPPPEAAPEKLEATPEAQPAVNAAASTTAAPTTEGAVGTPGTGAMPAEAPENPVAPPKAADEALDMPSFGKLIGDGPSVTINVTIQGAEQGELAFQTIDDSGSRMLHVQPATSSALSIKAPAIYDGDIYVSISVPDDPSAGLNATSGRAQGTPDRKGAGMQVGGAEKPLRLAGGDVSVTVVAGQAPSWLQELAAQGVREGGGERTP